MSKTRVAKRAHHLKDLTVETVSLVDKAAVRRPDGEGPQRFLLYKRADGVPATVTRAQVDAARAEVERLTKAVKKAKRKNRKRRQAEQDALQNDQLFDGSRWPRNYTTNQPTASVRAQAQPQGGGNKLSKSERRELERLQKPEDVLTTVSKELLRGDLSVAERDELRRVQTEAYRALEDVPVAKDDSDALMTRARWIQKDERTSTYEAMRRAFTPEAQRAYLNAVR
jgi:hypothetical protein